MTAAYEFPSRKPRRGELDHTLGPRERHALHEIHRELHDLHHRAALIDDDFLAQLIETAADEARDQLRDDLLLRERESAEAHAERLADEA